jgi:hypothetical protein
MEGGPVMNAEPTTETVLLKNGAEEVMPLVATVMLVLERLVEEQPVVFYELVMVCRDPHHTPWGQTGGELKARELMSPDGHIHNSIRNIVLSAVEGDGLGMQLVNPMSKT